MSHGTLALIARQNSKKQQGIPAKVNLRMCILWNSSDLRLSNNEIHTYVLQVYIKDNT